MHEFYWFRDRFTRYLVTELGFTAYALDSGFCEGRAVHDWTLGGPGDIDDLLRDNITYHMGDCTELRDQLIWLREHRIGFHGIDIPGSAATALPAVKVCLSFVEEVDPVYAKRIRSEILPLFDYLPERRDGMAWAVPACVP